MEITAQHPWREQLLAPLQEEQVAQALNDDDPHWTFIDSEMIKLGSLAHNSLDIKDIQQKSLRMLAEKSKDFRLFTHLLRTLQHGGQPEELLLAVVLLNDYVKHYWAVAWPVNALHKRRLAQQVIKRFETASVSFVQNAPGELREEVLRQLVHLAQLWQAAEPMLAQEVDGLSSRYRRQPDRAPAPVTPAVTSAAEGVEAAQEAMAAVSQNPVESQQSVMQIDTSSERHWRQTLLKMAELLCERHPEADIGYRLRRHGIWGALTAPPLAQADGRTPLAAVAADRIASYQAELGSADSALWQQVEQSLTLAPYWLDGHYLSAQVAERLDYPQVARAICEELGALLTRLPQLRELSFTDRTPFLSPETALWLQGEEGRSTESQTLEQDEIWQCYQQQGLEAALQTLDRLQQRQSEPRDRFYSQLLSARLLEQAGLTSLAQQHYQTLLMTGQRLSLSEWEPALLAQLTQLTEKQRREYPS